uniref:Putative secreted protein n=1 Tax=Anopheles marajoara TaxID=58244 RepID=A0A2M4C733_9DIPT
MTICLNCLLLATVVLSRRHNKGMRFSSILRCLRSGSRLTEPDGTILKRSQKTLLSADHRRSAISHPTVSQNVSPRGSGMAAVVSGVCCVFLGPNSVPSLISKCWKLFRATVARRIWHKFMISSP